MHVAICDDNVADRKHIERLLSRESYKRIGTPNILYIESFGDKEQFLHNPLKYDILFMDMASTPTLTSEIISTIIKMGFDAPIILYSSKIDYTTIPDLPDTVVHMKKPYISTPLPDLLKLGDAHSTGLIESVTLHNERGLFNMPKNEILYAIQNSDGTSTLYMMDDKSLIIKENIADLRYLLERYHEFVRIKKKVIINLRYIAMLTPLSIMSQDHRVFHYLPHRYKELKEKRLKANR